MASDNLIPLNKRTDEEKKRISAMGGKASGEAKRRRKMMKEALETCLELKDKKGLTYRELATMGLIKGAVKGNAQNYRVILETLGELKPSEEDESNNGVLSDLVEALQNVKKD